MSSTRTHPRRRPQVQLHAVSTPSNGISLPKAPTYHPSRAPTTEGSPALHIPSLPIRSLTSASALHQLIQMSETAIDDLVGKFDDSLSGLGKKLGAITNTRSAFTTPAFVQDSTSSEHLGDTFHNTDRSKRSSPRDIKQAFQVYDDSGLGSSLEDSESEFSKGALSSRSVNTSNTSLNSEATLARSRPGLSEHATRQIKRYLVRPILQEEDLSEYHGLIKQLPTRIASRKIQTLRDLEKTLIFLAPAKAKSASSYLRFCEFSIQCVHTTVDHLNVLDQRKPSERPYNNLYFVDLVEQIRQYARIMAVTRAKKARGEPLDDEDHQEGETLKLVAGNATKPAELVRERKGKPISIDAGRKSQPLTSIHDLVDENDEATRSMGRKRKCDIGKIDWRSCRECGKRFTRPCDLTKHEKTHSRPWKCTDPDCRYYTEGWPTQKECERHMNDKHSKLAKLYKCLYEPCPYTSKRESNCKQHMEKAHGWRYERCRTKKGEQLTAIMVAVEPKASKSKKPASNSSKSASPSPIDVDEDMFTPSLSPAEDRREMSESSTSPTSPHESVMNVVDFEKLLGTELAYYSPAQVNELQDGQALMPVTSQESPSTFEPFMDVGQQFSQGNEAYLNFVDNFQIYQPQQAALAPAPVWPSNNAYAFNPSTTAHSNNLFALDNVPGIDDAGFEDWLSSIPQQYPPPGVSPMEDFALYDDQSTAYSLGNAGGMDDALMFPTFGADDVMLDVDGNEMSAQGSTSGLKMGLQEDPVFGQWMSLDGDAGDMF